jgi:hypothetical protein
MAIGLLGLLCLATAVVSALLASEHMILRGAICGVARTAHCGWCYSAAAFAFAGIAAFAATAAPQRRPAPTDSAR